MNIPANLKYSNDHEWVRVEGNEAFVGITDFNEALENDPALVNKDPYGEGWIIKVNMANPAEVDTLLSADDYAKLVG